ncbi:MAG: hypothetical protein ACE5FO_09080 [Parvularculaceae bacterium]
MRFGFFASLLVHLAVAGLALLSLPESWRPDVEAEPYVPIELIREAELAEKTSVPAAQPEPVEEVEPELPEPEPEPEPVAEEPAPVEPEPEPEPAPVIEEPAPEPEKKVTPAPEAPNIRPKKESDELDLEALSALVDKAKKETERATEPSETPSETAEESEQTRRAVGAGDRLTASDYAKLQAAMYECWRPPFGAPEAEKLNVIVEIRLDRDGTLDGEPKVLNATAIALSGNPFWKTAEQAAVRAVISCQPYDFLSQDRYETWREIEMNFDMTEMVGR